MSREEGMKRHRPHFLNDAGIFDLFLTTMTAILLVLGFPRAGTSFERTFRVDQDPIEENSFFLLSDGYLVFRNHHGQQNFTRLDSRRGIVSSQDFFNTSGGWPRSATPTSDGGYLIAGVINTVPMKGYLMKLSQHLEINWGKEFGHEGDIWIGNLKETSDGGYIVLIEGEGFVEIVKLRSDSSLDWQKRIVTRGETEVYDIYEVYEGIENSYAAIYGSSAELTRKDDIPLGIMPYPAELRDGVTALSDMSFFASKTSGTLPHVPLLEFGAACAGETTVLPFRFENASSAPITIINISSPVPPFYVPGCDPADPFCCSVDRNMGPGEFCFIPVQFSPPAPGLFTSVLDISYRNRRCDVVLCDFKLTENLTGIGGQPLIHINPTTIDFGNVCAGNASEKAVTIRNDGDCPGLLGAIGSPAAPFNIVGGTCSNNQTLNPGGSCSVIVRFTPPSAGSFNSSFAISSVNVTVAGTGRQQNIALSPGNVDFGNVCAGNASEKAVTVRNDGDCPGLLGAIGSPAAPFSIVGGTCSNNQTLNPGGSCSVIVRFTPPSVGSFNSSFTISSVNVTVAGTGRQQNIALNPANVDFGNVCAGNSLEQAVTVQNAGDCSINLGTIGAPAAPFSIVGGTCSNNQTLIPNGSCTVTVRFTPTSAGSFNSSLAIASVNVILTGISGQQHVTVNPTDVNFDNAAKGKQSEKTITVTNAAICPSGLTLKSISAPEPPFSIVGGTCQATVLQRGESCSIVVRFLPTQAGPFASSLHISSDDPDEPVAIVNLRGGSGPDLVEELTTPLVKQCRNTRRGVQCTIKAALKIKNIGTNDAPPCCVEFYLSGAGGYHQGDPLLMRADSNGVKLGKSGTVKFNIALPPGETGVGKFLTIVLNGTHCFIEANEANSVKSYLIPK